jgi:hypothetical protein
MCYSIRMNHRDTESTEKTKDREEERKEEKRNRWLPGSACREAEPRQAGVPMQSLAMRAFLFCLFSVLSSLCPLCLCG